jgi:photosystem II stability/assembly factor-like uncharacterized protein
MKMPRLFHWFVILNLLLPILLASASVSARGAPEAEPATGNLDPSHASFPLRENYTLPLDKNASPSAAEDWHSYPIYGGEMTSIAMGSTLTQTIYLETVYVGTQHAGVFKTTDGGRSWGPSRTGLTFYPITSLRVDPQHPDTVYAGTEEDGVWKSVDGGNTWTKSSQGLDETLYVHHIVINPQNATIIYVGLGGYHGNIYRSEDGAANWEPMDYGIPRDYGTYTSPIFALAIDPDDPSVLYAGTREAGAFKTTDGGQTWTPINDGIPTDYGDDLVEVNALAVDPHHANRPSAIIDGHYYVYGTDDRWTRVSEGSGVTYTSSHSHLYFHPSDPNVIYCAGHHFAKSTDGGVTWDQYLGFPNSGPIPEIAFHPSAPDTIFAAAGVQYEHRGGVYKSQSQGETWSDASDGITAVVIQGVAIDPQNSNNLYAGLSSWLASGVWRSHDRGATWRFAYIGRDLLDIAVDPLNSQKIYATAETTLWESTNQGASFQEIPEVKDAQCIATPPHASSPIYVGTRKGVYKSSDAGLTWEPKNTGLPLGHTGDPPTIVCLAVDPTNSSTVWAGTQYEGVAKSTDGGEHWEIKGFAGIEDIDAVAVKPGDSNTILVGTGELATGGRRGEIYKSTDGGQTWHLKRRGVATITDIKYNPRNPEWVYASTGYIPWFSNPNEGEGILHSFDGGEHWHDYSAGIFYPVLYSLAITEDDPLLLIAGSYGSGLYWTHPPTPTRVYLPVVMR